MKCKSKNKGRIIINPKILILCFTVCTGILLCLMLYPERANSGPYLDSAHGDTSIGVNREGLSDPVNFGYSKGNCAHCHEQHASIGGSEPQPRGGSASKYLLFRSLFADQGAGFCFRCHIGTGSIQVSMPAQYNYSRIAGGDTNTCPNGIMEAFAFVNASGNQQMNCSGPRGSSHFLADIQSFLTGKWNFGGTTGNINPCSGCHNPHRAKRDPHTNTSDRTSSGDLIVSSVSRPSQHNKDNNVWELWGDESGERMSDYSSSYQAPYRNGGGYEPDGSTTTNGSNLVDYVTFCTDCHNSSYTITSHVVYINRVLYTINWNTEKHGKGAATNDTFADVNSPFQDALIGNYVLSCTDCHEPHGAPAPFLARQMVNGGSFSYPGGRGNWRNFCRNCHNEMGHSPAGPHDTTWGCMNCHNGGTWKPCTTCHYHGGSFLTFPTF